jgi:hypothetical protein
MMRLVRMASSHTALSHRERLPCPALGCGTDHAVMFQMDSRCLHRGSFGICVVHRAGLRRPELSAHSRVARRTCNTG